MDGISVLVWHQRRPQWPAGEEAHVSVCATLTSQEELPDDQKWTEGFLFSSSQTKQSSLLFKSKQAPSSQREQDQEPGSPPLHGSSTPPPAGIPVDSGRSQLWSSAKERTEPKPKEPLHEWRFSSRVDPLAPTAASGNSDDALGAGREAAKDPTNE